MKKQKLFALALAGVTTLGTLAAGTPVMAEEGHSGNTTVNLNVKAVQGEFLLTVPANVILNSAGEAVDFADDASNGIKVSGSNMTSSVVVSATSQNGWTLKAEGIDDYFNYHLYMDKNGDEGFEKMEFTADEVNTGDGAGTTKMVYAKAEANDNAKAGTYSDVITFTAEATGTSGGEETPDVTEKSYQKLTLEELTELYNEASASGESHITYDESDNAKTWGDEQQNTLWENGDYNRSVIVICAFDQEMGFETYHASSGFFTSWNYEGLCARYDELVIYLYK